MESFPSLQAKSRCWEIILSFKRYNRRMLQIKEWKDFYENMSHDMYLDEYETDLYCAFDYLVIRRKL